MVRLPSPTALRTSPLRALWAFYTLEGGGRPRLPEEPRQSVESVGECRRVAGGAESEGAAGESGRAG